MERDAPVVALVTYESPFFAGGGIAPVVRALCEVMGASENVVVVTPFHSEMPGAGQVRNDSQSVLSGLEAEILMRRAGGATYFFVRDRQGTAFRGAPHPYALPHKHLVRDALLFGKWAAGILNGMRTRLVLLNDWQAAAATLWSDIAATLVLHNGYDSEGLADDELRQLGCPKWQSPEGLRAATILERAIPMVVSICAVSDGFARELSQPGIEPATDCLGPQITRALHGRTVAAVPNAPFLAPPELAYADALKLAGGGRLDHNIVERTTNRLRALRAADRGEVEPLLQFKADRADRLRRTLTCASDVTVWGDIASFADSREPLVVIGGRCDFRIKGHDVAAAVAATRAAQRKRGRWLFLLIPQSQPAETDLMELRAVAEKSGGRVLVIPSVWRAGYLDALESAAFCLFPSTVEPFGGVSEPVYLGTPVVARATGGLVDQIVPLQGAVVYDREVEIRTRHHQNAAPTGILYREHPRSRSEWERLLSLVDAPIAEKWRDPVFGDLVDALDRAIDDAIAVWDDPVLYGELVANGIRHLRQHFTWRKTAAGFLSQARLAPQQAPT